MKHTYQIFKESVKSITDYYMLLVEETKSQRLVGSTNEWVLDNYYMISELEKELKVDLTANSFKHIGQKRINTLEQLLIGFLTKCHYQVDKTLLIRYLSQIQVKQNDYMTYPEVCSLLPLMEHILIHELAELCRQLKREKAYHHKVTDNVDINDLDKAAQQNLLMMNIFNSLKKMTRMRVSELIDTISFSERLLKSEKAGMYDQMYDKTKEDYRAKIVRMCKQKGENGKRRTEYELVKELVAKADERHEHVGWQLFPPKRWNARAHWYIWIVLLASLALAAGVSYAVTGFGLTSIFPQTRLLAYQIVIAVLMIVPMSQIVIDLFNRVLLGIHKPMSTFKLKFKDGLIPKEYATMVIMPTILKNKKKTVELLEQLEVYYLSNINRASEGSDEEGRHEFERMESRPQNLFYTLVGDAASYSEADAPWDDEVVEAGMQKVKELNEKYGTPIFNFVYRKRAWSDGEQTWLGYERKRGAILHFNDLVLGHTSESDKEKQFRCETITQWRNTGVPDIQFIITLDTDTELVLYSAQKLIGSMAHPLNRAKLSADGRRVDSGYGIMQPRVNVDVEVTDKSRYAQLFAGLGGLDVYTTASFELYQDIFNEGSFCGKGIYDLKVFQHVLKGTFPENLILSHDLIEGCHIRCGLINDIELFDDNPDNYIDDAKRHHRWTRGDWQIIGWLKGHVRNESGEKVKNQVNTIGRWKIFDNLRRSMLSLALVVLVLAGYGLGLISGDNIATYGTGNVGFWLVVVALLAVASPIVFFIFGQVTKLPNFGRRYHYYATLMRGFKVIVYRSVVQFALLPKEAWMYTDAAIRACYRMWFSHRNLLNWITSEEASKSTKGTLGDYFVKFWFNYICAAVLLAMGLMGQMGILGWIGIGYCAATWCGAPLLMYWLGRKFPVGKKNLDAKETEEIRQLAKDTWNFFDSLINEENNFLIPDNYQQNREEKTDYKTSPTNIGFSLVAVVSAAEMGFIKRSEAIDRISLIIDTVEKLEKWNGHLFNWYDIRTLEKLPNYFVSTADSGNFVACLYVVNGFLIKVLNDDKDLSIEAAKGITRVMAKVQRRIALTDFNKLYNRELDVFSIGYDWGSCTLLPYNYNNFASEARLTSYMTIAQGDAPYKHWFCLDKTLVQYKGYKGVASWYGTLFEYFMPYIFLPTYKHTLMDETYSFAIRAQRAFIMQRSILKKFDRDMQKSKKGKAILPWGISETAYNELDDAKNYKYQAFGVPYLKFQNTTPDRIVISPYSSIMTIGLNDRAVYENIQRLKGLGMYDGTLGLYESYDEEDHAVVKAHYAHHQGMILASLANYLCDNCIQQYFMHAPFMRSMETLLKEKAMVKPYIDLKVTQYKRYRYSKVQTESDARDYEGIARVPEVGIISNGQYTVLMNDRGSGFSRFNGILLNRYRKISSDHYGTYLYIRDLHSDKLWSATYSPLDVMPESYHVSFASDKLRYLRSDNGIETKTEVTILKDRSAEVRRFTFTNNRSEDVDLEITSYAEVVLAVGADDESHRVFNSMKIFSSYDAQHEALLFSRPTGNDSRQFMMHKLWVGSNEVNYGNNVINLNNGLVEYETSRIKFLGRGGSIRHADIIESRRTLTGTVGTTLDPIMSMRRRLHIPAGKSVEAYIITGFSKAKEQLLQLTEQYQSPVDIEDAFKTSSVFNNMRTNMSLLKGSQMKMYNNISKYMAQTATLGNHREEYLQKNKLSQSGLWRFGISGDIAILLMEIDSMERSGFAKEMLRAFEYYKVHGLALDIVFINDATDRERDALTHFIRNMANTEHLWTTHSDAGHVYVLDGHDVTDAERTLLRTVARLNFTTTGGVPIEEQIAELEAANQHYQDKVEYPVMKPSKEIRVISNLEYYNQYGGFDNNGRDYVVVNTNTPMPWVNVMANEQHFGCIASCTMAGFTFAHNAQQFKITGWSNDIVRDNASEMLLIDNHQFIPATARHSQGWSAFDADYDMLHVDVRLFVAVDKMEKYYQIRLLNKDDRPQSFELGMVYKLVLGVTEEQTARYLYSIWDEESNSLLVRNVYNDTYRNNIIQITSSEKISDVSLNYPNRKRMSCKMEIPAYATKEVAFIIAVHEIGGEDAARINEIQHSGTLKVTNSTMEAIDGEFKRVEAYWDDKLSHIQVDTPDRSLNYMLNRWYLYQVLSSRLFARAGFYQVGGATGFRDQLQDVMSVLYSDPDYARRQILDHAAHQFAEGDVLHWWHASLRMGARTTFSDDYLWLVFVTYQYIKVTGDTDILSEMVPFCQADQLAPGEAERGMNFAISETEKATLYEHLKRALNRSMSRIGRHNLPLMGCGDWNDGMSRVGVKGKGESVWVAFFLCDLLPKMEELTQMMPGAELGYCEELRNFRNKLVKALQQNAWDGNWFLRAYYDDGTAMGSRNCVECQIDLISQAWSILTDVATPEQKESVMRETDARLVNREHEIIQLLTPAFKNSQPSPGYIMNYPEGVRENGGQYTHGAMWYIMAQLKEGRYDMGYFLYSLINPIHRTQSLADVLKYKVEPFCIAADIYSNPQHPGRGGWTWYTGSASWAYKTGIENILGLRKNGNQITFDPRVPSDWNEFSIRYRHGSSTYIFKYVRESSAMSIPTTVDLVDDGQEHTVTIH